MLILAWLVAFASWFLLAVRIVGIVRERKASDECFTGLPQPDEGSCCVRRPFGVRCPRKD